MVIFAIVDYRDSLLCIEVDDSSPNLLKTGRVVQRIEKTSPVEIQKTGTDLVVVPPAVAPKKSDRTFRLVSIQRIHERNGEIRRADTRTKVEKVTKAFNRWIHAKLNGDGRKPFSLATFFARFWEEEMKDTGVQNYSDLAYQIAYSGWRKKLWEIDDTGECKLLLLEQK